MRHLHHDSRDYHFHTTNETITAMKVAAWLKADEATSPDGVVDSFVASSSVALSPIPAKFPKRSVVFSKKSVTGSATEVTLTSSKNPVTGFELHSPVRETLTPAAA